MKRLLFVLIALAGAAFAGEWHVETLDFCGDLGCYVSLALDSNDQPHISYHDSTDNELKHALWDGDEWLVETVSDCGLLTSLALDSEDRPHMAYFGWDSPDRYLMYAHWDGDEWRVETVASSGYLLYISLALDSYNRPHISYYDFNSPNLKYAYWDGDQWQVETVDSEDGAGSNNSIALDSNDRPHISYIKNGYTEYLKYARWDGDEWHIETVEPANYGDTSLALDSSDRPCIAYTGEEWDFYEKCASWDGGDWRIENVEPDCGCSSLALDDGDNPHISYLSVPSDIRYARWHGSGWWTSTFDMVPELGDDLEAALTQTSLALDSSGLPHIAYQYEVWDMVEGYPIYYVVKYAWYESGPGVEGAQINAAARDEGILVGWTVSGDTPAGLRVLRSAGESEPVAIHDNPLPGTATHYLDRVDKGLQPLAGVEYRYWLDVVAEDGTVSRFGPTEAVSFPGASRELALSIYPSPASDAFTVDYTLPEDSRISISLYDLSGRRIATVLDSETAAGRHAFSCDAAALTPGVYLVHLDADAGSLTQRVVIAR